ncbi:hypothetical protein FGO68_gene7384 [Halteria grandinella]|uniref:Uncharacterized protein n=1 Tax=Halteria grandinella TaxID=5974 RepID=A0A8J8P6S2_HALGN|nr:hypothetical protein FGO68_gene7384 [Halteria grandinella]
MLIQLGLNEFESPQHILSVWFNILFVSPLSSIKYKKLEKGLLILRVSRSMDWGQETCMPERNPSLNSFPFLGRRYKKGI